MHSENKSASQREGTTFFPCFNGGEKCRLLMKFIKCEKNCFTAVITAMLILFCNVPLTASAKSNDIYMFQNQEKSHDNSGKIIFDAG